ncbi:ROK family transcriptional regulator [Alicyclobacillus fodiniaquatilis]|uniref:ROK family protein n=1 Tax=Alicyclobacillus fodiniaquatilis TaxID=1661150 RepID=A0ABW4JPK8_9BACL
MSPISGTSKDQKGTKSIILQTLRIRGPISRAVLSEITKLSRATISEAITSFIDDGWIIETEKMESRGGRPAISLELAPHTCAIIGADLDDQVWTIGAFDLCGNRIHSMQVYVEDSSPEITIQTLLNSLHTFIKDLDITPIPFIGIGSPGLVDSENGIVQSAADLGWKHVEIGKRVEKHLGWQAVVLNRYRARGLAECRYGAGRNHNEILYIGVGNGLAGGLYLNRQLITGFNGGAGEIGHMTIEPNGPICPCGNRGCLQMIASGPALVQETRRLLFEGAASRLNSDASFDLSLLKPLDVCKAANEGDSVAKEAVEKIASYLGIAMANLVNVINPEVIILGGVIPKECPHFVNTSTKVMHQRGMKPLATSTFVKTTVLNTFGGALGAANYALDRYLTYPILANLRETAKAANQQSP